MKVMTATDVKNKVGDAWSFSEDDSLLIEKNGKEAFMAFSAQLAKKMVLTSYSSGMLSRSEAMKLMGFKWYGDLLDALADAKIDRPTVPVEDRSTMVSYAKKLLEA